MDEFKQIKSVIAFICGKICMSILVQMCQIAYKISKLLAGDSCDSIIKAEVEDKLECGGFIHQARP